MYRHSASLGLAILTFFSYPGGANASEQDPQQSPLRIADLPPPCTDTKPSKNRVLRIAQLESIEGCLLRLLNRTDDSTRSGVTLTLEEIEARVAEVRQERARVESGDSWWNHFGVGLTVGLGGKDRVGGAALDANDNVVVTKFESRSLRVVLEAHQFLWNSNGSIPFGPFVMVNGDFQNGARLGSLGGGLMAGFRGSDAPHSFNVGLGLSYDMGVTHLRSDFVAGQPAPTMTTTVDGVEKTQPVSPVLAESTAIALVLVVSITR